MDEDRLLTRPASTAFDDGQEAARALRAAYREHGNDVYRFALHLTGDPSVASDVTQETFTRAVQRLEALRLRDRLRPWLFGIARNVAREHAHASRKGALRTLRQDGDDESDPTPATGGSPEERLLDRELAVVLQEALRSLSVDRRAALVLRVDRGLPYLEIADIMGWSLAKTKVEIHRARTVLRDRLARYRGGEP